MGLRERFLEKQCNYSTKNLFIGNANVKELPDKRIKLLRGNLVKDTVIKDIRMREWEWGKKGNKGII